MSLNYSVKIFPLKNQSGKTKAFASVVFDDIVEVKGFKVIEGANGLFVSMPSQKGVDKDNNETWYPNVVFHEDATSEKYKKGATQTEMEEAIVTAYSGNRSQKPSARGNAAAANSSYSKAKPPSKPSRTANPYDDSDDMPF
jgi:stage V sporulation protein G